MKASAIHVVVIGAATGHLALHVAAMQRRLWRVEWGATAFSAGPGGPSAVIIDQASVPRGTDAFRLALRARKELAIPVVILTSTSTSESARSAQAAGCTCVSTPCRSSSLIAGVTSAIAMAGGKHWKSLSSHERRPR